MAHARCRLEISAIPPTIRAGYAYGISGPLRLPLQWHYLVVTVADAAIAFGTFHNAIAAAVTVGGFATGDAGTVAGTAVAVLARFADTVTVAGGLLAGRISAAVTVVAVDESITVIIDSIIADGFRGTAGGILAAAVLRTA